MGTAKQPAKLNGPGQLTRRQPPLLPLSGAAGRRRGASPPGPQERAAQASRNCTTAVVRLLDAHANHSFSDGDGGGIACAATALAAGRGVATVPPGRHGHLGSGKRPLAASADVVHRRRPSWHAGVGSGRHDPPPPGTAHGAQLSTAALTVRGPWRTPKAPLRDPGPFEVPTAHICPPIAFFRSLGQVRRPHPADRAASRAPPTRARRTPCLSR